MNKLNNKFNYSRRRRYIMGVPKRKPRPFYNRTKYSRYHYIPAISNKPITMGYGTTTVNVTKMFTTTSNGTIQTQTIKDIIFNSEEFTLKINEYMYFKVNYVKILIFPSQPSVVSATEVLGNDIPVNRVNYIYFNWARDDTSITTDQLANSDNSKIISTYITRNKIYTFIPPNFTFNGLSGTVNPTAFSNTQFNDYPGFIKFLFFNVMQLRIEVNITFRGAKDMNTSALILGLQNLALNKYREEKSKNKESHKVSKSKNKNVKNEIRNMKNEDINVKAENKNIINNQIMSEDDD